MADYLYCVDTNALIDLRKNYPPELFPSLWKKVDKLIADGRAFSCIQVRDEIKVKHDGELHAWAKNQDAFFHDSDKAVRKVVTDIMDNTELADEENQSSMADPWVIAHAKVAKARVVSHERYAKTNARVKLPDVCRDYGVICTGLFGLMKLEKWSF